MLYWVQREGTGATQLNSDDVLKYTVKYNMWSTLFGSLCDGPVVKYLPSEHDDQSLTPGNCIFQKVRCYGMHW